MDELSGIKDIEIKLNPSVIWEVVEGCKTFESFYNTKVPVFNFHSNIPIEIKSRLETIQKLIVHSYFEYEFIDVAYLTTFQTFEFALHLKFQSLNPGKMKKNLALYLDWAISKKIISINKEDKEALTYLRNHRTHLKQDLLSGTTALKPIKVIGNLICEIFSINPGKN